MAQLLFPNIAGATLQGFQQGQQMRANRLVGAAMQNPGDAQGYLAQAGAIDPRLALGAQGAMQQQQAQQQAAQQSQQTTTLKQIGGAARYYKAALQSGNPASVQAAKAQIGPLIMRLTGKQLPDSDTPETQAALDNVIAQTAYLFPDDLKQQNPISVGPDTTLIDPRTHQVIYQGQGDAGAMVTGMTYNGMPVFRDKMGNLKDVRGNPIPAGAQGAPAGAGGVSGSLPAETQAYVPKVLAALQGQPAFDQSGQPTPQLLDAVQKVESNGNPNVVSPAGAQGAYQFMPATAASVGVQNPFDPTQARQGAAKYLAQLYQQFGGDANKAIAAYNAGPGRVQQASAPQQGGGLQYSAGGNKAPTGYRFNADGTLAPIPGGPADKTQVAAALGDPQLTGQAYLSSIQDKGMQALVKAIAEGREQVPRIYRSQKAGEIGATAIAAAVAQYDPTFNAQDYNSRNRTRIAFTSGKPYQDMMALSQASQHVGQLVPLINQLAGHAVPFVGGYINAAENKADDVYSGKLTSWNTVADAVAHETRKVFAGSSGGTLSELDGYLKNLSPNSSVAQKQAAVQGIAGLLESRIGLLRDAYAQGMGKAGDPFNTTFPESAQTLQYLTNIPQDQVGVAAMPSAPQAGHTVYPNGQQPAPAAAGAPSGVDSLLSKYGIQ